jgi:phosphoribosylanthranilate isomerase
MLQTFVKISNVTNLSDARYCAGMGVDMLGFSMDADAPDYVDPKRFAEMRQWIAGVQIVGETNSTDPETIETLLDTYQPDALEVDESALLPYLATFGRPLLLRIDLTHSTLEQLIAICATTHEHVAYFLLESPIAIHLDDDLKTALRQLAQIYPILLGVGIAADTVQTLLTELPVRGIALQGGDEDRPGSRDFGALMDVLEAIDSEQ